MALHVICRSYVWFMLSAFVCCAARRWLYVLSLWLRSCNMTVVCCCIVERVMLNIVYVILFVQCLDVCVTLVVSVCVCVMNMFNKSMRVICIKVWVCADRCCHYGLLCVSHRSPYRCIQCFCNLVSPMWSLSFVFLYR